MVFQNDILAGASGSGGSYQIDQSVWFDGSTGWLNRTMATGTDAKTFSFSVWFKQTTPNNALNMQILFGAFPSEAFSVGTLGVSGSNQLSYRDNNSGSPNVSSASQYRDPGAWMHLLFVVNTTEATASNRVKIYTNGTLTTNSSVTYPSLNETGTISTAVNHEIGRRSTSYWLRSYVAEMYFIDGQALAPTDFGEYNDDGVWVPKAYVGTYGINGFYLDFADAGALGTDVSGNGNNWTVNGTITQVTDSPTNNFPTFSSINLDGVTLADGNLKCNSAGYYSGAAATMSLPTTGKWYIETLVGNRSGSYMAQGFVPNDGSLITNAAQAIYQGAEDSASSPNYGLGMSRGDLFGFYAATGTTTATVTEPDGSTLYSTNEIYICHAIDLDNERYFVGTAFVGDGSVTWFGHAGIGADPEIPSEGLDISAYLATYGSYGLTFFHAPNATSGNPYATVDFGQSGFTYTPPTGFAALSTANLPAPAVKDGSKYFQTTLYTGNGTAIGSGGNAVTQIGNSTFQPDFVWMKSRSAATDHALYDAVRGTTIELISNSTAAESTLTEGLTTFGAAGFTVGSDAAVNTNAATYVAWQWLAANGTVSNTDGTITSTVSANTTAGISISTYTGNATSGATIGHGLGVAPDVIIVKNRDAADAWQVYHSGVASDPATDYLVLNTTAASVDNVNRWNDTAPTSSVFSLGNAVEVNTNTEDYVAYCFAGVEGFSKFGKYTGNGSMDGPMVNCGFRPAFILVKKYTSADDWLIYDAARGPYNVTPQVLKPNSSAAETATDYLDLLSNGFKARTTNVNVNGSGSTFIFMAFAEHPFGGAGVAPATAR